MITQPIPRVTHEDVERIVSRDFPSDSTGKVFAILSEYGTEESERGVDRVRLAALKLAAGSIDRLRSTIETARGDYRDVLQAAEYPQYSRFVGPSHELSPKEIQRIIEADWKQYRDWLAR